MERLIRDAGFAPSRRNTRYEAGGFSLSDRRFARGRSFMKPRLGAVPYLNTRPLVVALERDPAPFALSYSVPSLCAKELAGGTIDVGIIPVIGYARSARPYWIVPDIAIGSQGPVLTVRLFCRRSVAAGRAHRLRYQFSYVSSSLIHSPARKNLLLIRN